MKRSAPTKRSASSRLLPLSLLTALAIVLAIGPAAAQESGPLHPSSPQSSSPQSSQPANTSQQPPPPSAPAPPLAQEPSVAITVNVPVVQVEAVVTDDNGNFLSQLKKENFRITEDGKPQVITNFATGDAPMTVAMVLEYDVLGYGWYNVSAIRWADVFLRQMKPVDWMALVSFNVKTNVEVDFTHDMQEVRQGLISMVYPSWFVANVYDAVTETSDRMRDVKGKKAILLLASGRDDLSRITFDKTMARLKESDIPVYCVGVAEQVGLAEEATGRLGTNSMAALVAKQHLQAFADLSGGRAWFPRFDGEIPSIMQDVATSLRYQYSLGYTTTNQATDGKYRKIKVELVDTDGKPLVLTDPKGKKIKYIVHARQGYAAPTSSIVN